MFDPYSDALCWLIVAKSIKHEQYKRLIKALTALEDRLSLSVGWENGPERGRKSVSFNP